MSERRGSTDTTLHGWSRLGPLLLFVSGSNEPRRSPVVQRVWRPTTLPRRTAQLPYNIEGSQRYPRRKRVAQGYR